MFGDIDRAVETGEDNARIRPDCEGWCEHIVVETLGISMVGQMTGVPIGPHRISCQHARTSSESVALRNLFGWFAEENCIGCEHYSAGSRPGFGRQTIEDIERGKGERKKHEEEKASKLASLRERLAALAKTNSQSAGPEAASIHRLAIDLFSEETGHDSVSVLLESCDVAPEFFDAEVIELFVLGISDAEFATRCLPVLAKLARNRSDIREANKKEVESTIQLPVPIEFVSDAIDAFVEHPEELSDEVVDLLVGRLDHQREIVNSFMQEPKEYPKSISFLSRFCAAARTRLVDIIAKQLESDHAVVRVNACKTLNEMTKLDFSFGLELLPNVIKMLELPEESNFGESSDHAAKKFIAEMMAANWSETFTVFDERICRLSNEARSVAIGAFDQLFRRGPNWRDENTEGLSDDTVNRSVDFCLKTFCNPSEDSEIRLAAVEALTSAASAKVDRVIKAVDRILGTYVLILDAEPPAPVKRIIIPGQEQASEHEMLRAQQAGTNWKRLQQETSKLLEQLGKEAGTEISETLLGTIETATDQNQPNLRAAAIKLLGKVAEQDDGLAIRALPVFMKGMMDFSDAYVRAVSLDAASDAFRYSSLTMPENIGDAFVLLLKDTFVMVHQTAIRSAWHLRLPLTHQQRNEAFQATYVLWRYYNKQPNEVFFLDDIAEALVRIAGDDGEMRVVAIRLISEAIPTEESMVDEKLIKVLLTNCQFGDPNIVSVAEKIILGLTLNKRDNYSSGRDWRTRAIEWLHEMPPSVWDRINANLYESAKKCIERDPYDAVALGSMFSEHGQHTEEHALLIAGAEAAKGHNVFNGLAEPLEQLAKRAEQAGEDSNV